MTSYSQCPGECYDSFWEVQEKPTNTKDLLDNFDVKPKTKVKIQYYYKGIPKKLERYLDNMETALKIASTMNNSHEYRIVSIEEVITEIDVIRKTI